MPQNGNNLLFHSCNALSFCNDSDGKKVKKVQQVYEGQEDCLYQCVSAPTPHGIGFLIWRNNFALE